MNVDNAVGSFDVVIHAEGAEWWQVATALAPLAVLLVLLFVVLMFHRSMAASAARSEGGSDWWSRAEWAIEMALDDNPERRKLGIAVLGQLSTERFVSKEDAQLLAQTRVLLHKP